MDELALQVIKLHWQRERWKELEEHKIMEKCLDEFYELGELTLATSAELAEYRQLLELSHPELMSGEQAWIGFGIAFAHVFFTQFGLNTKVPLSEDEIKSVQAGLGVEPTGRWGLVTVRAAKELQKQLQDKGLYTGPVDGLWGSKLAAAWRNDRRQQGLGDATTEKLAGKRAEDVEQSRAVERLRKLGIPEFPFDSTSEQQKGWAQTAQTALQNRLKELTETFRKLHGRYPLQGEETPLACEIRALNKLDTLIRIGLRNREAQRQRQAKQQLEDFWKDFFAKGGQWSKMRDKFQLECIELWVAAACFAYDAAAVASWASKNVFGRGAAKAVERSLARRGVGAERAFQQAHGLGAAANKLRNELAALARKAVTSTGRKGSQALVRMARKAGLKVVPGGNHLNVYNVSGMKITQIPHSLRKRGTAKAIIEAIMEAAGF